jgi:3-methyladenine DNA glycosylase/8-oxoguanine DNA glycosylase
MGARVRTTLLPPRLASLPQQAAQLERSSRAVAFVRDGRRLLRAWGEPDRPYVLAVAPTGARWEVEAWGVGPTAARRAVREMFGLTDPLEEFYRRVRAEPVLRGSERSFRGLRLPRDASIFEALLLAIVGQQLSVAAAGAIQRRLWARFGRPLRADGVDVPAAPSPAEVVGAGAAGLRSVGLSRAKARALVRLARWATGAPPPTALRTWPLTTARELLERRPGVGRWTAENALLRGAGRADVFVAGDLGVRVALDRYGAVRRDEPEARARAWAEDAYPGWGGYATLYLWRKLGADRASAAG